MLGIVSSNAGKIKVTGTNFVGYGKDIINLILNFNYSIYTQEAIEEIYNLIVCNNITDKEQRKNHLLEVKELKRNI